MAVYHNNLASAAATFNGRTAKFQLLRRILTLYSLTYLAAKISQQG